MTKDAQCRYSDGGRIGVAMHNSARLIAPMMSSGDMISANSFPLAGKYNDFRLHDNEKRSQASCQHTGLYRGAF
jgi:hypothetical protein